MLFSQLVEYLGKIEGVSSRNEITSILVDLFNQLTVDEAQIVAYFLQGRVAPLFVAAEFQFSEKSIIKALKNISKEDVDMIRQETGDIGSTVEKVLNNKSNGVEITKVYEILWILVNIGGTGSVESKTNAVLNALSGMSPLEAKYFSRIVCGALRLGSSVKTLLDAFSFVLRGDKSVRERLDSAYGVSADIGHIAKVVMSSRKVEDLELVKATVGVPILSRLVERSKGFEELQERMGDEYYVQPKFDGLRVQIHKSVKGFSHSYAGRMWYKYLKQSTSQTSFFGSGEGDDNVRLFTRNLEDVTDMFPEIVEAAKNLKCDSCILDGELVGWDYKTEHFKSYQDTMTRRRKYDVAKVLESVPVKAFVFDIMALDGESLVSSDTDKRINVMNKLLKNQNGEIIAAQTVVIKSIDDLKANFDRWVKQDLEGLIAKKYQGGYTPGGRNFDWIKLKKSFMSELSDSVDVVILGFYRGSGKRAKFGIGALLCGVYNEQKDRFESVTKLGTGITDEQFGVIMKRLEPLITNIKPKNVEVDKLLTPDVWVFPEVVCTVEADDITKAMQKGSDEVLAGGLSLRFPRLIEFDRDKEVYSTTTVDELVKLAS